MVVSDKSYLFVTGNSLSLRPPSFNSPHRCASSSSFSSDLVISPLLRWEYSVDAQSIGLCVRTANATISTITPTRPEVGASCNGYDFAVPRRKSQTSRAPSPPAWRADNRGIARRPQLARVELARHNTNTRRPCAHTGTANRRGGSDLWRKVASKKKNCALST